MKQASLWQTLQQVQINYLHTVYFCGGMKQVHAEHE